MVGNINDNSGLEFLRNEIAAGARSFKWFRPFVALGHRTSCFRCHL